jgi:flagellar hook-length control protein FliK
MAPLVVAPTAAPVDRPSGLFIAPPAVDVTLPQRWDSAEFAPALGRQMAFFARDGIEHARVHLNPLDMGPIQVQLALDGTQVRLDLAVEVAATRLLLEQSLPQLASALREGGFTLTGGGVFQDARQAADGRGESTNAANTGNAGQGTEGRGDGRGQPGAGASPGGSGGSGIPTPARARRVDGLVDLYA